MVQHLLRHHRDELEIIQWLRRRFETDLKIHNQFPAENREARSRTNRHRERYWLYRVLEGHPHDAEFAPPARKAGDRHKGLNFSPLLSEE